MFFYDISCLPHDWFMQFTRVPYNPTSTAITCLSVSGVSQFLSGWLVAEGIYVGCSLLLLSGMARIILSLSLYL
jgi:TRAP-type mannitol/chloroaromatic compound transport system permease small subunit